MREAVGNTFIVSIIITFVIVFIILFATSTSYTKAYKVKNKIIDIIEENNGVGAATYKEIDQFLGGIGYRVNETKRKCPNGGENPSSSYRYCIYPKSTSKGVYYVVTAYMYFDVPILSAILEMPVQGETKILGILSS